MVQGFILFSSSSNNIATAVSSSGCRLDTLTAFLRHHPELISVAVQAIGGLIGNVPVITVTFHPARSQPGAEEKPVKCWRGGGEPGIAPISTDPFHGLIAR